MTKQRDKLLQEGRPVMAKIVNIRPVSTDESGNTTVVYVLDIEGHILKGSEKIDTFYAPQLQPGENIKVIYKDDKNYMFVFDK